MNDVSPLLSKDLVEISGWIIGLVSFIYALYCQYKNQILANEAKHETNQLREKLESLQKTRAEFARTIHDLCFQSQLRTKNYPGGDIHGLALQRESLNSTIASIQRIAQEFSDRLVFQGEFVWGSELGAMEEAKDISRVWLISRDLLPDSEDTELQGIVARNLSLGRRYRYVFPDILPTEVANSLMSNIRTQLHKVTGHISEPNCDVILIPVPLAQNQRLFAGGSLAVYEINPGSLRPDMPSTVLAFEEVMIPDERRGALWRRHGDIHAKSLLGFLKQLEPSQKTQ